MRDSFEKRLNKRRSLTTSSGQLDWSRCYFLIQSLAGAMWWIGVFTIPGIRNATLGTLPAQLIAWFDIPLFVLGSLLLALGWRQGAWVVLPWITLVTAAMFIYSLITATAGLGTLIMIASWVCSLLAAIQMFIGRIPSEHLIRGPFAFRTAPQRNVKGHFWRTASQLLCFWALFLFVIPAIILVIERRLNVMLQFPVELRLFGVLALISASSLGIWSAVTMSTRGQGTPLPSSMPRRLVISGPYRFVRNPMAVAGITQGVAVGLISSSWLVVVYALAGSLLWNWLIRPQEEANLEENFAEEFRNYKNNVSCWVPTIHIRRN